MPKNSTVKKWLLERLSERLFDLVLGAFSKKLLIPFVGLVLVYLGCDQPLPPVAEPVPPTVWENAEPQQPAAPTIREPQPPAREISHDE